MVVANSLASSVLANTITFETAPLGVGITAPITENGFTYSTLSGGLFVSMFGNPGHDAEGLQSAGGGVLKIVSATGGNFDFNALDFAAFDFSGAGSKHLRSKGFSVDRESGRISIHSPTRRFSITNTEIGPPKAPLYWPERPSLSCIFL